MAMKHDLHLRAAKAAREYVAGTRTWNGFQNEFGDSKDEMVADIVDLFVHEPKRGGFLGASEREWADHRASIEEAIRRLEASIDLEDGTA
jgi:hypothetical protein